MASVRSALPGRAAPQCGAQRLRPRALRPRPRFAAPPRAEASSAPPPPDFGTRPAISSNGGSSSSYSEPLGSKLEKWMRNPLTFLAMGPRAGLGAFTNASDVLNRLPEIQAEVEEKVNFVLNDPRPVEEKQQLLARDIESTLAELIQTGEKVETDMLSQMTAQLPPEVLEAIPAEIKSAFPGLQTSANSDPFADDWEAASQPYTYTSDTESPSSAELVQLKDSASALRAALERLQQNADPSNDAMLKVNLRDARDALARRVQEANTRGLSSQSSQAAVDEASGLLRDVDSLLF